VGKPTDPVDPGTVGSAVRPFRQQVEEGILDAAAALFARHGYAQTSVQAVADAVGYSKAGLLHHYPSKESLRHGVLARCREQGRRVADRVAGLPPGVARDRRAVEELADLALTRPGLVAFLLGSATGPHEGTAEPEVEAATAPVYAAFAVDPATAGAERLIRVTGALAALAVLALAAHQAGETTAWRQHIVATSFDALGHRGADAPALPDDQVEA
jgi:AcrR family transcriptional regulator